jgi:regulator of protease activity HflC (stomatin/prohibitin superfamily)
MNSLISFVAIIGIVYGVAGYVSKLTNKGQTRLPLWKLPLAGGIVLFFIGLCFVQIGAQSVGVVITPAGVSSEVLHTGWHLILPWNSVKEMEKTEWVYTFSNKTNEGQKKQEDAIWAPTKDGIKMGFDISISWKIEPELANWIYANISDVDGTPNGRHKWIEENIVRAKTISELSLAVSEYTPIEAYSTKRENIQNLVFKRLAAEFSKKHLILLQVNIREVYYNPEYEKAINAKKLAEQEVLRLVEVTRQKEEKLKQAEIDKNISIQTAEGEAKALEIKGNSIRMSPQVIQLNWIDKWDGK